MTYPPESARATLIYRLFPPLPSLPRYIYIPDLAVTDLTTTPCVVRRYLLSMMSSIDQVVERLVRRNEELVHDVGRIHNSIAVQQHLLDEMAESLRQCEANEPSPPPFTAAETEIQPPPQSPTDVVEGGLLLESPPPMCKKMKATTTATPLLAHVTPIRLLSTTTTTTNARRQLNDDRITFRVGGSACWGRCGCGNRRSPSPPPPPTTTIPLLAATTAVTAPRVTSTTGARFVYTGRNDTGEPGGGGGTWTPSGTCPGRRGTCRGRCGLQH